MLSIQKLARNGSSTVVTIPAPVLQLLGWRSGDYVALALTEAGEVVVRLPRATDFQRRAPAPAIEARDAEIPA